MIKPQLPDFADGVLPTAFVHPEQAKRLSQMFELSLEQASQVAGGAGVSSGVSAAALNVSKFRLCRIIACRVMCRISCMVATPQLVNQSVSGG